MSSPGKSQLDAIYPEPLSRLRRGNSDLPGPSSYRRALKKQLHRGNSGRFRTQPVTFHEIKEVDEENLGEAEAETSTTVGAESKSESDLKAKFELFYRSIKSSNDKVAPPRSPPPVTTNTGFALGRLDGPTTSVVPGPAASLPVPVIPSVQKNNYDLQTTVPTTSTQASPAATSAPLPIAYNPRSRPSL